MDLLNKFPLTELAARFPSDFKEVLELLHQCELELMIVGGFSRDYFSTGKLSHDIDAELRPAATISRGDLETFNRSLDKFKRLMARQSRPLMEAGVGVYKTQMGEFDLEFSIPRTEIFRAGEWGHSNFDVHFDPFLSDERAFIRRDFTLNSIGIRLLATGPKLVDPYGGLKDLEARVLRPVSTTFHLDPVRALRAIRFHLTLDLSVSPQLEAELQKANFSELTAHYIALESKKAGIFLFLATFKQWAQKYQWEYPASLKPLSGLDFKSVDNSDHQDPFHLYVILASLGANESQLISFALIYGLKQKEIKQALRLIASLSEDSPSFAPKSQERQKLATFNEHWRGPIKQDLLVKLCGLI